MPRTVEEVHIVHPTNELLPFTSSLPACSFMEMHSSSSLKLELAESSDVPDASHINNRDR